MAISLKKGANTVLPSGLNKIVVGLGWDPRTTSGDDFDLDASAFLLNESGKVRSDRDFIFYNQMKSADGSVEHSGDNLTGGGEGDDEQIKVTLNSIPADVQRIAFTVTIHDAESRVQNFGQVSSAFIRIVDEMTNEEIARFDLSEDASIDTAMIFGEVYRKDGEWKFKAVGQGFAGGLAALARYYGVNL
ncbi:MAG: TerD family protein [Planctomycetaceae bacterium]|nr:TerD family protein [Planctomycetaceae bacterium]